jgi:hypothetical protein
MLVKHYAWETAFGFCRAKLAKHSKPPPPSLIRSSLASFARYAREKSFRTAYPLRLASLFLEPQNVVSNNRALESLQ